ncbi:glycine receptor subunit alpha-2-like isoform X2 [Phlebotomus papatasi]|uniref:glycine receptor subunit alpha-2-like isoform X2 n=1 Tax=Phlebotomus papatasi TaxID=29031 RepID=UPI002483F64D|nr:glycine receptor subunit alpha-2-like isoform X2 [Phlebotomus papatasi]
MRHLWICAIFSMMFQHSSTINSRLLKPSFSVSDDYDRNMRPNTLTEVSISLLVNRISGVDETKEMTWEDIRIRPARLDDEELRVNGFLELTLEERNRIWIPDLYIRQLREMKLLKLFEEISSLRLYGNSTINLRIGATIIINCDMNFVLYPLDVQKCRVDFSSYKYPVKDMTFRWKKDNPLTFPHDFGDGFFRLPRYVVSFLTDPEPKIINYGDADHCSARLEITLSREVKSYLLENYLPSTLFVSMSWGSFVVVPEIVPGRMVLLVTTLLSLVTMFDTVRNNSPDALELKCIEVWLISCTLFVFLALMEYFIVLFGIRYDKHWRTAKTKITISSPSPVPPSTLSSTGSPRKNGLEHANRIFATAANRISPDERGRDQMPTSTEDITSLPNANPNMLHHKRKFRNVAEYALLYAGSQRGRLDQISLILFPISFLLFTTIYWVLYLSESRKKM